MSLLGVPSSFLRSFATGLPRIVGQARYKDIRYSGLYRGIASTAVPNTTNKTLKLSLIGASIGVVVGTGYSIHKLNKVNTHISNEIKPVPVIMKAPDIPASRDVVFPGDRSGLKLTLYQYQTCPFCCKVRAFLDYYGVSYKVVEVDPVLKQAIRWSQYKKVPILLAEVDNGYQQLNDSSMIISALSSYLSETKRSGEALPEIVKYYPSISFVDNQGTTKSEIMNRYFLMLHENATQNRNTELMNEERKWREWADSSLVHTLSPNVYRTREEALQAFNWFSSVGEWEKNFPVWERYFIIYVGAFAMWIIGKRIKNRYSLKDDVRQSLYDECNHWARAVKRKGTPFMGGDKPNLSDLAVYGVLNSIEGCNAFQDALNNTSISEWYKAMKTAVINHEGMISI